MKKIKLYPVLLIGLFAVSCRTTSASQTKGIAGLTESERRIDKMKPPKDPIDRTMKWLATRAEAQRLNAFGELGRGGEQYLIDKLECEDENGVRTHAVPIGYSDPISVAVHPEINGGKTLTLKVVDTTTGFLHAVWEFNVLDVQKNGDFTIDIGKLGKERGAKVIRYFAPQVAYSLKTGEKNKDLGPAGIFSEAFRPYANDFKGQLPHLVMKGQTLEIWNYLQISSRDCLAKGKGVTTFSKI